jgi:glycosyltransferase involved in cell wall biosynthesis
MGMGGAERHSITLANLLSDHYRVAVAYLKPDQEMLSQLDRDRLIDICSLGATKRIDLAAVRRIYELLEEHRIGIIICANAFSLLYAHLARLFYKAPVVLIEVFHTTTITTLKEHLAMLFYRPLFWATDHVVFVCHAQKRHWNLRGLFGRRNHVIHNGVNLGRFSPSELVPKYSETRKSVGFKVSDRVIGICAVLRPEKAHEHLLAAVARLRRTGQPWKVLIIGDGPMRPIIDEEVKRLGLETSVRITGFQSDVRTFLATCDVIALVSITETFSLAVLEAMAMAKPIILSDVGGAREQITSGSQGMLFPAGDVEALAAAISRFWIPDDSTKMGSSARKRVEIEFSEEVMIGKYLRLLSDIIQTHRSNVTATCE